MTSPAVVSDPRVAPAAYVVYPTGFAEMVTVDKHAFCLYVVDGMTWGWSVRASLTSPQAMNRKGQWVWESGGSGHNRFRRWPLDEALEIALRHVDSRRINGGTAAEWDARHRTTYPDG